jgi:hypothetical protein
MVRLVADDRTRNGEDGHDQWRCRADPLPLTAVLKAEARTCGGHWRPIDLDPGRVVKTGDPNRMGYRLGKTLFAVRKQITTALGVPIFDYLPADLDWRTIIEGRMPPLWSGWRLKRTRTTTAGRIERK